MAATTALRLVATHFLLAVLALLVMIGGRATANRLENSSFVIPVGASDGIIELTLTSYQWVYYAIEDVPSSSIVDVVVSDDSPSSWACGSLHLFASVDSRPPPLQNQMVYEPAEPVSSRAAGVVLDLLQSTPFCRKVPQLSLSVKDSKHISTWYVLLQARGGDGGGSRHPRCKVSMYFRRQLISDFTIVVAVRFVALAVVGFIGIVFVAVTIRDPDFRRVRWARTWLHVLTDIPSGVIYLSRTVIDFVQRRLERRREEAQLRDAEARAARAETQLIGNDSVVTVHADATRDVEMQVLARSSSSLLALPSFRSENAPTGTLSPAACAQESLDDSDDTCRICKDEGHDEPLLTPCACTGSMKYIHLSCLNRWREEAAKYSKNTTHCEVCRQRLKVARLPRWTPRLLRHWLGIALRCAGLFVLGYVCGSAMGDVVRLPLGALSCFAPYHGVDDSLVTWFVPVPGGVAYFGLCFLFHGVGYFCHCRDAMLRRKRRLAANRALAAPVAVAAPMAGGYGAVAARDEPAPHQPGAHAPNANPAGERQDEPGGAAGNDDADDANDAAAARDLDALFRVPLRDFFRPGHPIGMTVRFVALVLSALALFVWIGEVLKLVLFETRDAFVWSPEIAVGGAAWLCLTAGVAGCSLYYLVRVSCLLWLAASRCAGSRLPRALGDRREGGLEGDVLPPLLPRADIAEVV